MKLLLEIRTKSKTEMHNFGMKLAKLFSLNDLITFDGELGVGKTFLCKSIINNLTKISEVVSPTFNIVQTYPLHERKNYGYYLLGLSYYEQIIDEKKDLDPIIKSKKYFTIWSNRCGNIFRSY